MTDEPETEGISRRRLLRSTSTIAVASTGVGAGAGSYAMFQDSERTTRNEVTAGTLDLTANETKSITGTVTDGTNSNLPGSNLAETVEVDLFNDGSLASGHVGIDFHARTDEDNNGVASDRLTPALRATPTRQARTGWPNTSASRS